MVARIGPINCLNRESSPTRRRSSGARVAWVGLLIAAQCVVAAHADPEGDRQRLAGCVSAHFTPTDSLTMGQMTAILIVDSQVTADDVQATFDTKKPAIFAAIAGIVTRLAEQDCVAEVHAAAVSLPSGEAFKVMFQTLGELTQRTMVPAMNRISVSVGVELLKSLDTKVTVDIFGQAMEPARQSQAMPHGSPATGTPGSTSRPDKDH